MPLPTHNTCPYALTPLNQLKKTNREHIFPDAIGGVLDYSVMVDEGKNSQLGTLLDAPLVNSPLIAGLRLMHGIKSRSGDPKWKMKGRVKGTQEQVEVTIPTAGPIATYVRKPIKMDADGKRGTAIFAAPDRDEFLKQLVADFHRKGKDIIFGNEVSVGNEMELDLSFDIGLVKRALIKIAYAAVYEFLGDEFLKDPLVPEYHKAIFSPSNEVAMTARIHGTAFDSPEMIRIMLPDLMPYEHAVSIANIQQRGPIVAVSLFGHSFHSMLALASETSNYGLRVLEGKVAVCDAKAGKTRFMKFEDHFVKRADMIFPPFAGPAV
jgi:hypothetical protein